MPEFLVSIVVLNFNGKQWITRCLDSLLRQTLFEQIEIIVADNLSSDGSDQMAREQLSAYPDNCSVLQNGANLGFCEGNNRGAALARGNYLLFLNNDTWLEPDCLAKLVEGVERQQADSASPMVLNYHDDSFQTNGAEGFDLFGYPTARSTPLRSGEIFVAPGCALLVRRHTFFELGGFDKEFFMYADESDLCWRLNVCGYKIVTIPEAKVHHRGAVAANPAGGEKVVEFRTTTMVRYYATRNNLITLLKSAQHILLALFFLQLVWVCMETVAAVLLTRSLQIARRVYLAALLDVWRLHSHIQSERRSIRALRKRGDFWMLRYFRLLPGRWPEIKRMIELGPPRIVSRDK